jgi:hypothetical protein
MNSKLNNVGRALRGWLPIGAAATAIAYNLVSLALKLMG